MRRTLTAVALVAAGLAATGGAIVLGSASPGGCPTALLLAGTLEADPSTHDLLVRTDDGQAMTVTWPIGYGVGTGTNGEPVLTRLFIPVAQPGDRVAIGGGEGRTTDFVGCGVIDVTTQVADAQGE